MKYKIHYTNSDSYIEVAKKINDYIKDTTIIICIGTDKCIGDCLGPLVGSLLVESNFPLPVFGTLESPIHALNIQDKLDSIYKSYPNSTIIGIDACLSDEDSIGEIHIRDYPIHPGKGVGKTLPEVGDYSIIGVVDSNDNSLIFTNRSIRLYLIMEMAKIISKALSYSYNL